VYVKGMGKMKDLENDIIEQIVIARLHVATAKIKITIYRNIFPWQLVSPMHIGLNKKFDPMSNFFLATPP
jgi:hypothetical protein